MNPLRSRLPAVGTTIFTVMSRLAAELGAINLSQGFPDFDCDPALVEAVARHMREGRNQYAPMPGVLALREAIAAKYRSAHGRSYDPETEVTITSGATEAIFDAVAALVHPGDEVIVLEPCYDSYVPAIELSGGVPVVVPLRYPDYSVDWDAVRARDHAADAAAADQHAAQPDRRGALSRATCDALADIVDGTDVDRAQRRGLRAHHLRRPAPREPRASRRPRRAQLRRRLVRQDVSRDRLEGRLRRGAGGADRGVPQGAPVRHVLDQHAGAARDRRVPRGRNAAWPRSARSSRPSAIGSSS